MSLSAKLESILFVSPKSLSLKELSSLLKEKSDAVASALAELSVKYQTEKSGFHLIENNQKYQLTTSPDNASLVKDFLQDEMDGELSQPSLEALTIIAYRGPVSKLELDRIRGVNCSLIIRNLLLRGLIEEKFEKVKNENYYTVSLEFIRFLGISKIEELPDYERLHQDPSISQVIDQVA